MPVEGKPEIKIRLQAIHNEKEMNLKNIKKHQETIPIALEIKKKVQNKIKNYLDDIEVGNNYLP